MGFARRPDLTVRGVGRGRRILRRRDSPGITLVTLLASRNRLRPILGGIAIIALICAAVCTWIYFAMSASPDPISRSFAGLAVLAFNVGVGTIVPSYLLAYLLRRHLGLTPILGP